MRLTIHGSGTQGDLALVQIETALAAEVFEEALRRDPKGKRPKRGWGERALRIFEGKASHVPAGMRRSATLRNLSQDERKGVDTERTIS